MGERERDRGFGCCAGIWVSGRKREIEIEALDGVLEFG